MVEPISLITVSLITFVVSALSKNPFFGAFTTSLFQVIWFSFFSSYFSVNITDYFIQSTSLILLWSFVGGFLSNSIGFIAILDPFYMIAAASGNNNDDDATFKEAVLITAKGYLWLILLVMSHVPIEYDSFTPLWKPSLTTACLVLAVFLTGFFLFNVGLNEKFFSRGSIDVNLIFGWLGVIYIITLFVWLILYSIPPLHKFFIVQFWSFYILLIIGFVVFIISIIIKYIEKSGYEPM
jgi:hypothetical protein